MKKLRERVNPGLLLVSVGVLALIVANIPVVSDYYFGIAHKEVPFGAFGLPYLPSLTFEEFVRDFILAIFFFAVGLELKQEFTVGSLRNPKRAALPIIAAVGGMLFPSLIFISTVLISSNPALVSGFAIPTATDIAFSVGILALVGKGINPQVRVFLLTLAVADDIMGILVIAIGYSSNVNFWYLLFFFIIMALFFLVVRIPSKAGSLVGGIILGLVGWYFMFGSGVHPAICGVCLGMTMSSQVSGKRTRSRAQFALEVLEPWSDLIILPLFAFFQLGVKFGALELTPLYLSLIIATTIGLLLGKPIGIMIFTIVITKITAIDLPKGLSYINYLGVACLAGTGFTVSFLVCNLAYADASLVMASKLGVLIGSFAAAFLAAIVMQLTKKFNLPAPSS
ncbi:MAG: Na+/H+ antiporter NhaA [Bifidobacteriaceae bacterium]|jgi:NhaA family Na+:H+ antiporter|nr:Na+/H+ antiporter NhaA [Bifidobacteriaceae bacterium]